MVTETEFKEIFKLPDGCKVPEVTLESYTNQIKGVYLLYEEIKGIHTKEFVNVDGTKLSAYFKPYSHGLQHFIQTLGSKDKINVSYIDEGNSSRPFWTHTKYTDNEITNIKDLAYKTFIQRVLYEIRSRYSTYGIGFEFRDYASNEGFPHPNHGIWWDGVTFHTLSYQKENGMYVELNNRSIISSFTNYDNILHGKLHSSIKRIIEETETETKTML